jgi:hypothetical protein
MSDIAERVKKIVVEHYSPPDRFRYTPRESGPRFEASPAGPPVQATVKWYNAASINSPIIQI